jgi:hypothetical protein
VDETEYYCWEDALPTEITALGAKAKALLLEAAGAELLGVQAEGTE